MDTESGPSQKRLKTDDFETMPELCTQVKARTITDCTFAPLYLISQWQEPGTTTARLTVAIILPSVIGADDFKLRVIEDGDILELTVDWPRPLVGISFMHKKWMLLSDSGKSSFTNYHPKFLGFEGTLRQLRSNMNDNVTSVARIPLPISVQTQIKDLHNIAWKDDRSCVLRGFEGSG